MDSESIAHETEGWMGYWLRGHEGELVKNIELILFCRQKARAFRY